MPDFKYYSKEIKNNGFSYFAQKRAERIYDEIDYFAKKRILKHRYFMFHEKKFKYLIHKYNSSWKNERTVEVPIGKYFLDKYKNKKILEIGNVMSHYYPTNHAVVDKYEKAAGIINEDIVTFKPKGKFDLIISLSTLEHVGWDEKPREALKILKAIDNIKKLLGKNGIALITIPVTYSNPELNNLVRLDKLGFSKTYYLKRISRNKWIETNLNEVKNVKYNSPFPNSNAIVIGVIGEMSI